MNHQHASQASEDSSKGVVEDGDGHVERIPQRPAAERRPPSHDIHPTMGQILFSETPKGLSAQVMGTTDA